MKGYGKFFWIALLFSSFCFCFPSGILANESGTDKFYSYVYSYSKVGSDEQGILKERILNSLMDEYSSDRLASKLIYLGERREDAVIRDLWPLVDYLESEVAAEAFLKVFVGDDRKVSERFYSAIRRRFGEIAGVRQVQEALEFYWNPDSAIQKTLAHGLLEKVRGEDFAEIFKTAYFNATSFEDAKAMFRLLAFQNDQEAFFAAMSILESLETDPRFSDDQKKYLISNLMVFFDSPEIEPFVLEGLASNNYWKTIGTVTALGNYGGVQIADSLRRLEERVQKENHNRSNSDQMDKRNSILLKSIDLRVPNFPL